MDLSAPTVINQWIYLAPAAAKKIALEYTLRFLGNVPMDPKVVMGGDSGRPYLSSGAGTAATKAFDVVLDNVIKELPVKIES